MDNKPLQRIKDFKIALKDMEPMVRNPKFLHNGRDIQNFSLRPREAWANWLLTAVMQKIYGTDITFSEDKDGDGFIVNKNTGICIRTEHVAAMDFPSGKILPTGEKRIITAIKNKINKDQEYKKKGKEYAKGKYLVVFIDGADIGHINKANKSVDGTHNFEGIFYIGLIVCNNDNYIYSISRFLKNSSFMYLVSINSDFTDRKVIQK